MRVVRVPPAVQRSCALADIPRQGHSKLPSSCPICEHSPLSGEDCTPHKSLRTTVRVFLRTEEKKREVGRPKDATPATPVEPTPTPQLPTPGVATPGADVAPASADQHAIDANGQADTVLPSKEESPGAGPGPDASTETVSCLPVIKYISHPMLMKPLSGPADYRRRCRCWRRWTASSRGGTRVGRC